jgi:hypothetical protein
VAEEHTVKKRRALEIYQDEVRSLPAKERLQLLLLIAEDLAEEDVLSDEPPPVRDIQELRGLGRELWAGIDAQEYVNALREGRPFPSEKELRQEHPRPSEQEMPAP